MTADEQHDEVPRRSPPGIRTWLDRRLAGQLSHPHGAVARLVARGLDRGNRPLIAGAVDALGPGGGTALADVGFGGGLGLALLLRAAPRATIHGVEPSEPMLRGARGRFSDDLAEGRLQLHAGTMTELPLPDAALDGVITVNTLYFVRDLHSAWRELARVLRRPGRLVLGINDPEEMSRLTFTAHGFTLRPVDEIIESLGACGLTLADHRRVDSELHGHLLVATLS
jgi:arsenite methyltransferase